MIVRLALDAMGTRFELVLHGGDEFFLQAVGEQAIETIRDEHRRLSLFDPASHISRVNAAGATNPVTVDRDLFDLLATAAAVWKQSGGAFDPAVGGFMRRWGHRGQPPDAGLRAVGFDAVRLDPDRLTVAAHRPRRALDLGGIAKGYALDRAAGVIREAGVGAALLHGGTSSIAAIGAPPGTEGWRVRLSSGRGELCLRDRSASISAPSGRVSEAGAAHIIDPRTGAPVGVRGESVVVCESGTLADAWATALVVTGDRPDRMPPEIGSAVRVNDDWAVSPGMEQAFRAVAPGETDRELDR